MRWLRWSKNVCSAILPSQRNADCIQYWEGSEHITTLMTMARASALGGDQLRKPMTGIDKWLFLMMSHYLTHNGCTASPGGLLCHLGVTNFVQLRPTTFSYSN